MNEPATSSRMNNFLRALCATLLVLCAVDAIYKTASIPLFYQRAVTQTLPDILLEGFMQASNESTAQEAAVRGMSIPDYMIYRIARDGLYTLVFYIVAFLILRRARGQWFLWFTALVLFFVPAGQLNHYVPLDQAFSHYLGLLGLLWPAFPLFLYLFPNGKAVPGWLRWLIGPVLVSHLFVQGIVALTLLTGRQNDLVTAIRPYLSYIILSFPLALFGQVFRYWRVSNREERLQTKWVLGGLVGVVLDGVIITAIFNQVDVQADYGFSSDLSTMLTLLIPITIGISILRYRLYDIDVIIRRTLVYSLLTALLGLLYFGMVILLGQAFQAFSGQESPLVVVISTLIIAALFTPLRRRIQDAVDRRFYRQKYNTEQALEAFSVASSREVELDRITDQLIGLVEQTVQPEKTWVWIRMVDRHKETGNVMATSPQGKGN